MGEAENGKFTGGTFKGGKAESGESESGKFTGGTFKGGKAESGESESGKIKNGLLDGARLSLSPFHDERPDASDISLLVIHSISLPPGEFGGPYIEQLFQGTLNPKEHKYFAEIQHLKVSSHLLIHRDGALLQFVPFDRRAWHAGESEFEGRKVCNDFSIGIELEGSDNTEFTEDQYQVLVEVTRLIQKNYPLVTPQRIVGHSEIAPGRKTDPGPHFDWKSYLSRLEG